MVEFSLRTAKFYPYEGTPLELRDIIVEYNFYESLDSASISAQLVLNDNNNLIESLSIFGQEKMIIEVGNDSDNLYKLELYLNQISGRTMHQKKHGYIMHLCSKEILLNESKRISKRFKNSKAEDIVKTILNNTLKTDKELIIDPSVYNLNFLSPNWKPLNIISWIQKRTVPAQYKDSAGYYFYETLDGKYNFRSIDSLISKKPFYSIPYTYTQGQTNTSKFDSEPFRIKRFSIPQPFNILASSTMGLYSHYKINLDVNNRKYYSSFESMDEYFEKTQTLNGQKPYRSSGFINLTKNPTRVIFKPFLSDTWSDIETTLNTDTINNNVNRTVFRHNLFSSHRLEIEIKGDMNLRVGSVVEISIPSPLSDNGRIKNDKRLSGRYLVHSIKHTLRRKVDSISYVTLVTDSYSGDVIAETKVPTKNGKYIGENS